MNDISQNPGVLTVHLRYLTKLFLRLDYKPKLFMFLLSKNLLSLCVLLAPGANLTIDK